MAEVPSVLCPLPRQPSHTSWPTSAWPLGDLPDQLDRNRFDALLDRAFNAPSPTDLGETHAVLLVQGGRLIYERYADGFGPEVKCPSWSIAKSITQAIVGIMVGDGRLDVHAPADVPEWREPGDPRARITLDNLLRMSSGLAFREVHGPNAVNSDVIEMLYHSGKHDMARFAADFALDHEPGEVFAYSSGSTNIVCRAAARALDAFGPRFADFMRERLFDPLGMTSADPKFDEVGTFVGSSFCYATPRDFARFGLLYLRDGVWEGRQLLPPGCVTYARTPTPAATAVSYGAHWWLGLGGRGTFSAVGYDGQTILICPDRDLILVRHGATPIPSRPNLTVWTDEVAGAFAPTHAA